jgi:hypothetical protein
MGSHAESQRHIALDLFIQIDRLFEGNQHQARQIVRQGSDVRVSPSFRRMITVVSSSTMGGSYVNLKI